MYGGVKPYDDDYCIPPFSTIYLFPCFYSNVSSVRRHLHSRPTNPPLPLLQSTSPISPFFFFPIGIRPAAVPSLTFSLDLSVSGSRSETIESTTRLALPIHPSNSGIPDHAYAPARYTIPEEGCSALIVFEGSRSGSALICQLNSFSRHPSIS